MKTAPDVIDEIRYTTQPLPRARSPLPGETIESYLRRLASANLMDPEDLRILVAGDHRKAAVPRVAVLARLSGHSERALMHALPELAQLDPATARGKLSRFPGPGCHLCNAMRGAPDGAWLLRDPEDVLCLRHCRWTTGQYQPALTDQPEILAAHRVYRRLARAYGRETVRDAYLKATWVLDEWLESGSYDYAHTKGFDRRIRRFLGPDWRVRIGSALAAAVRYPQVVALTRLLASPHWMGLAIRDHIAAGRPDPEQRELVADRLREYRRTVVTTTYGLPDPFTPDHFVDELAVTYLLHDGPSLRIFLAELRRTVESRYKWFPYPKKFLMDDLNGAGNSSLGAGRAASARPRSEPGTATQADTGLPPGLVTRSAERGLGRTHDGDYLAQNGGIVGGDRLVRRIVRYEPSMAVDSLQRLHRSLSGSSLPDLGGHDLAVLRHLLLPDDHQVAVGYRRPSHRVSPNPQHEQCSAADQSPRQ